MIPERDEDQHLTVGQPSSIEYTRCALVKSHTEATAVSGREFPLCACQILAKDRIGSSYVDIQTI